MKNLVLLVLVAALAWGYSSYQSRTAPSAMSANPSARVHLRAAQAQGFTCDGRTHCSQMTSCEEAEYFLAHCPDTQMDGNGDGEPCERQWCN